MFIEIAIKNKSSFKENEIRKHCMSEVALVASRPIGNTFKYAVVVGDSYMYRISYVLASNNA